MTDFLRSASRVLLALGFCVGLSLLNAVADAPRTSSEARHPSVQSGQSATLLPDGSWLLLGGRPDEAHVSGQAVLVDSALQQRQVVAQGLNVARAGQSATVLPDGSVLVIGGVGASGQQVSNVERYHPDTQQFENVGDIGLDARTGQSATLLSDGRVLIVGGTDISSLTHGDAELLDPSTMRITAASAGLTEARSGQLAQLLPSGDVLIWGGRNQSGRPVSSAELYDAATGRFQLLDASTAKALIGRDYGQSALAIEATLPEPESTSVTVGAQFSLRFSKPLQPGTLTDQTVTLVGPNGVVDATVVAAEGGLLAFVKPKQQLLPGSRYTLFVQGAQDADGQALPFTGIGFQTANLPVRSPSKTTTAATAPPLDLGPDDSDGEMWVPAKRNLTGVWRSGHAERAQQHLPRRDSVAGALSGQSTKSAPGGMTTLAGQVLRLTGAPLAHVTLSIASKSVATDGNGEFLLSDIPSGTQTLVIDGSTADMGQRHYGRYEYRVTIEAGKTNALPFVIWMTRLDTRHTVTIASPTTTETVVSNPHIPGLELHIPADTVIRDSKGAIVTQLTMTALPVDQPPFPLPNHQVPVYFTIQPGGARLLGLTVQSARGARLIYPNFTNSSPGTRIDFWNYDSRVKGWYVYGQGTVSADRKQIVPDQGVVLYEFSGAMVAIPSLAPTTWPAQGDDSCHSGSANSAVKVGDPVDCYSGLFVHSRTDLVIRDTLPLEVSRTYRPNDSASRAFGIGSSLSYDMFLVGDLNPWTYQDLILPDGGRIHFVRTSSGTNYADAVYRTTTPGSYYGSTIKYSGGWNLQFPDGTVYLFPSYEGGTVARCGALNGIRDRYGNTLTFVRDSNCNLTSITSPNGRQVTLTYDTSNRIKQASDDIGRTVTYQYDSSGRLLTATDPANKSESYTYDDSNRMLTVVDKRGNTLVKNTYYSNGRVKQQDYPDGTTASFTYVLDANGNATQMSFTNERGVVKQVQFNSSGLPTQITDALGKPEQQIVTIARDPTTNLAQTVTDAMGRVTAYQYDNNGKVKKVTYLSGTSNASTWSYTYEPDFSQLATVSDPAGHTLTYSYDTAGNLTTITSPLGNTISMMHNSAGQITSITRTVSGNPLTTIVTYNGGDVAGVTDPLNRATQFFTDAVGRTVTIKDPLGNFSQLTYDTLDRLTQSVDPLGNSVQYTYDENGNLKTFQDPRNNVMTFNYDTRNRVSATLDPLNHSETYQYDAAGNLLTVTDRQGQVRGNTYDFLDRVSSSGFGATSANPTAYSSTIGYTWDSGNRLKQAVDSVSGTITLTFDDLDRLTQEQSPRGQIAYTYYPSNLRHTMTVSGQTAVNYTYDDDNRLTQIARGSATVGIGYDTANRRTSVTLPNGIQVGYGYDNANGLTGITYQNGSVVFGNLTYGYDAAGRRTGMGGTLASVTLPSAVTSASYDAANRIKNWGASAATYDNNGDMTGLGSSTYGWDARDQLTSTSDGSASFAYDAFGRRLSRTVAGAATTYLHDGFNPVIVNSDFLLQGLGLDETYARINASGTTSYLTDALGSTLALTNSSGATTASYSYSPYGLASKTGTDDTPFRFAGREDDGASNLDYYRARYYSPQLGRFMSEDPLGIVAGPNNYAYVLGNPISHVDPFGLWASVSVSGNYVRINIPINYLGPGATPAVINAWNQTISNTWSGQFGQYKVTTTVSNGPLANQITVPLGNGRAFVNAGDNTGVWPCERPGWTAAHESGHLMGLRDEYSDSTGPYPGWEHDIMGARGYGPSVVDIEAIILINAPF